MKRKQRELVNSLAELVEPVLTARRSATPAAADRKPVQPPAPRVSVRMASADTAELLIYGRIGGGGWFDEGGVTSMAVLEALREAGPAANIHVRINSGGGDVFEGVAIHTALRRHAATVTTYIDGLAASAASFIAMAGDRIVVARGAMMMIHDGMTLSYGAAATLRREAELLDKVSGVIADLYAARAGEDADHWRALMTVNGEDGTWFTAEEAVAQGLADEMTDPDDDAPVTTDAVEAAAVAAAEGAIREAFREVGQAIDDYVLGVDQSAPDSEQNADQPPDGGPVDNETEADLDFRFRMRMWQFQQQRHAAA